MKKSTILLVMSFFLSVFAISAQENNAITTAAPFLNIAPDARAGGMGDMGVATSTDAYSQHWNAAKFAFMPSQFSVSVFYSPWLRNLTDDIFLGGFSFANKLDDRSSWSVSLKYFNLGEIDLRDEGGDDLGIEKINEFSIDGAYSLKLSDRYAMGVTLRFIRSDLGIKIDDSNVMDPVNTFAVDISGFFQTDEANYGTFNGIWRGGFNISNIGPKVSYTDDGYENYIPTNLGIGGGFDFIMDDYNKVGVNLEFNKLLVPTPSVSDDGSPPYTQEDVGFVSGMFSSFGDAPDGFSEEMKEFTWALGAEYLYNDAFALRAGYFHESDYKGARQYFTVGAGFKFKSSTLDFSYLINSSDISNPLENTLRFSLAFDFGELFEVN